MTLRYMYKDTRELNSVEKVTYFHLEHELMILLLQCGGTFSFQTPPILLKIDMRLKRPVQHIGSPSIKDVFYI